MHDKGVKVKVVGQSPVLFAEECKDRSRAPPVCGSYTLFPQSIIISMRHSIHYSRSAIYVPTSQKEQLLKNMTIVNINSQ